MIEQMMSEENTQWSFLELFNLPIVLRQFFMEKMVERQERKLENIEEANKKSK